ncbi:hypothetical protein GMB86_09615 [Terrilactibacillus sp. BCM23-1]|uniref:Uncharacterized protein n=1 Tax=Terrilactibacillus tamarindi TaxID=2599694 RepID=A0A6N8CRF1_9BACI|nr:hypothetical protein [Terrilactibacillus tamarindi]MTT32260.1 hypothetical protein [Terrilactibacillus tamarindi]
MIDQAESLRRRMENHHPSVPNYLAISGHSRNSAQSQFCLNLSQTLGEFGKRVLVIYLGNDVQPWTGVPQSISIAETLNRKQPIKKALVQHRHVSYLRSGSLLIDKLGGNRDYLKELQMSFNELNGEFDMILFDFENVNDFERFGSVFDILLFLSKGTKQAVLSTYTMLKKFRLMYQDLEFACVLIQEKTLGEAVKIGERLIKVSDHYLKNAFKWISIFPSDSDNTDTVSHPFSLQTIFSRICARKYLHYISQLDGQKNTKFFDRIENSLQTVRIDQS